jgi:hypothetical protein
MSKIEIEGATDNEQRMIDAALLNLTNLATDIRAASPAYKKTVAYGRTFGRYIEAKWALGCMILLASGMPDLANNRNFVFEWANAHLFTYAPHSMIFDHGHGGGVRPVDEIDGEYQEI